MKIKIIISICVIFSILLGNVYYVFADTSNLQVMEATISGTVWEDIHLEENEYGVLKGNGTMDAEDQKISGMKVQLYKLNSNENTNVDDICTLRNKNS